MDRKCLLIAWSLALVGGSGTSFAQGEAPPDILVDLNEGIFYYLDGYGKQPGEGDPQRLTQAIETFTSVLDRVPDEKSALLFRALARGELGLIELKERQKAEERVIRFTRALETREDESELEALDAQTAQLEEQLRQYEGAEELDEAAMAEWIVVRAELLDLTLLKNDLRAAAAMSDEKLEEFRWNQLGQAHAAAQREQEHYREMMADLEHLIGLLEHPDAAVRLLEVVANAKMARIDETTARDIAAGDYDPKAAPGPVGALRSAAAERLERAANVLQTMLGEDLPGEHLMRTKFFLGVIRYRQGLPSRAKTERFDLDATRQGKLAEARGLMTELADDETATREWRSYAALYLGLIIPFQATTEPSAAERERLLDKAEEYLRLAARLDVVAPENAADKPTSDSGGVIPMLVARQRKEIATLRGRAVAAAPPINDLRLSVGLGAHRDTNVVLLGERTDLPRDISREEDFGFTLITAVDYTKQLVEGLTFGFQGRMSQLWHADVDEFDQQSYGGSVALQYEALQKEEDFGPVYLVLQYDYDYTLLGRSAFLESHLIRPSARIHWADRHAATLLYFDYGIRDYREPLFDTRYNRDGNYLALGLFHEHKTVNMTEFYEKLNIEPWGHKGDDGLQQDNPDYPNRYLKPRIGVRYSWDSTDGDEFDRKAYELGVGAGLPLPWGVDLDASATFEWGEYAHGSLIDFHRRPRRDFTQEYGLSLSRTFVLREGMWTNRYTPQFDRLLMTVRAHATWTHDDSNVVDRLGQAIFEYDRVLYGITVGFAFN